MTTPRFEARPQSCRGRPSRPPRTQARSPARVSTMFKGSYRLRREYATDAFAAAVATLLGPRLLRVQDEGAARQREAPRS